MWFVLLKPGKVHDGWNVISHWIPFFFLSIARAGKTGNHI